MSAVLEDQRTDEQLIAEAAREGSDGPAFVALLERHRERIWRVCYRLMGNESDAHDAAQEVFVRLFLHRDKFAGRARFTTWLHGLALRTCLTLRRTRGRRQKRESAAAEENQRKQDAAQPAPGLALEVMQLLEGLPEEDRAMLILKFAEGYSYEDLAEMFELSVSACKMRVSRAKEKVQQMHADKKH
ncbi:MAG: RNA polymerase sigma factor [Pirellulales bacterium]